MVERSPSKIKCVVTTRDYSELNQFLQNLGLEHKRIGRHGGGDLAEKLRASIERQKLLASFAESNFDFSFSFLSPEAARVSFGLGLKHYSCSDSPHASAPSRLVVPLSRSIFTPFPIRKGSWTRYGIEPGQVHSYYALDPWAWLQYSKSKPSKKIQGRVLIRLEEWFASYFKIGLGVSSTLKKLVTGIKRTGDYEIVLLPRYDEQRVWAKRQFGKKCIVPKSTVDGAEMISMADLLIGGGATMTQEAALIGIPNISYFPSAELEVFSSFYFPRKLSVRASRPNDLLSTTFDLLKKIDKMKELFMSRAAKETASFEDPVKFVFKKMLKDA